jgi:hypothetical protein
MGFARVQPIVRASGNEFEGDPTQVTECPDWMSPGDPETETWRPIIADEPFVLRFRQKDE